MKKKFYSEDFKIDLILGIAVDFRVDKYKNHSFCEL